MTKLKLIGAAIVTLLGVFVFVNTLSMQKVEGDEAYVRQHWKQGVVDDVYRDGTHFFVGWFWDIYRYDIGTQKITFDSDPDNEDAEYHSIKVNVGEDGGQSAWIPLSVNYRIGHRLTSAGPKFSAKDLVTLHKDGLRNNYENVILKRTIVEVVNRIARPREALQIYSGAGFNAFVEDIKEALINHEVFNSRGILIENVIVYNVGLNPEYEAMIEEKQLAIQKALKEKEQRKAADETALRVKSEAQAEVELRTQKANAAKAERIKAAEAAKAEVVLAAEAKRESDMLKAEGVRAIGTAEAEVDALKREALYAGPSGAWRAKVEIATAQAEKLHGIFQGTAIVPEKTILNFGGGAGQGLKMVVPAIE